MTPGIPASVPVTGQILRSTLTNTTVHVVAAQSPYSVQASDDRLMCDATDGAIVILLPKVAALKNAAYQRDLTVKKIDAVNPVTLTPASTETIDGAPTLVLSAQYDVARLTADPQDVVWWLI